MPEGPETDAGRSHYETEAEARRAMEEAVREFEREGAPILGAGICSREHRTPGAEGTVAAAGLNPARYGYFVRFVPRK